MIKKWVVFSFVLFFMLSFQIRVERVYAGTLWQAKYWDNKSLSGDPVLVREEIDINYDWGNGSPPGVTGEQFSARWKKTLHTSPGTYRFTATMDDGMRVWVDDALIIDSWYDSQVHSLDATIYLAEGEHAVKVEYYDAGGGAIAKLNIVPLDVQINQWRGEYFNNSTLSGTPVLVRDDANIDFNWGGGSPAWNVVGSDQFSVRWTRTLDLEPGRYRWTATADDGVRVWVNGRLLIDKWQEQASTPYTADIDLLGGPTDVRMEYYENVGGAVAKLNRTKVGGPTGDSQWWGEYYNNTNLTGTPVLARNDKNIDFNWGNQSPAAGINADNFSVRWTRNMYFSPGLYRFTVRADDGVRVWVNGQRIIDAWYDHPALDYAGDIELSGGYVDVKMEYYDNAGGASANLTRTLLNAQAPPTPVPPQPTGAGTATVQSIRLNLRQGPAPTYDVIQVLTKGDTLTLLGRNMAATWAQVRNANGVQGWVYAPLLQSNVSIGNLPVTSGQLEPTAPTGPTAVVSNAIYALNVRSGADTSFPAITAINRGQTVTLIGRNAANSWLKIQLSNGTQGWASATYLNTGYDLNQLPIVN